MFSCSTLLKVLLHLAQSFRSVGCGNYKIPIATEITEKFKNYLSINCWLLNFIVIQIYVAWLIHTVRNDRFLILLL